jgi:hypothetical protein
MIECVCAEPGLPRSKFFVNHCFDGTHVMCGVRTVPIRLEVGD